MMSGEIISEGEREPRLLFRAATVAAALLSLAYGADTPCCDLYAANAVCTPKTSLVQRSPEGEPDEVVFPLLAMAAMKPTEIAPTIRTRKIQPTTMPAVAMPRPVNVPRESSICRRAR